MKKIFLVIFILFQFNLIKAESNLTFFLDSAYQNNPRLNAERKNFKATKENINISRSEFLPNLSLEGNVDSSQSSNRTNKSGASLSDTSLNTETKKISVDQKIFQGFEGYNSLKKSQLEVKVADLELKNVEQNTLLNAASVYYDLIYKSKNKKFNILNVDLFERQVESDSSRVQKGEITLTDLAQSESSLAGAKADLISADTELLTTKTNFERIIRLSAPNEINDDFELNINLPKDLTNALKIAEDQNPKLLIAKLNFKISERELNIEKAQFSPSASLNYSKSEIDDFSATVDQVEQETVKATVTWPIIKGGKNFSSVKKSKLKKEKMSLILQDTINEVKTNTANAWSTYQSAQSVLKATESQVKAAEIANEGITLEYDSGNTRTTLEVIQSTSLLLDARIANAKSERDFRVSKFELLAVIGNLTLDSIKQ